MAERAPFRAPAADTRQFLTFRTAGRVYALPASEVREIVPPAGVAKVPLSPKPLLGLANLRGAVLPVVSMSLVLENEGQSVSSSARIIVLEGRSPFGLHVDEVLELTQISHADIDTEAARLASADNENVVGVFAAARDAGPVRILDIHALLARILGRPSDVRIGDARIPARQTLSATTRAQRLETFITFEVAGQEFALPLASVREVLPTADISAPVPRAETSVIGLMLLRSELVPLLSMRALMGHVSQPGRQMTLVVDIAGRAVGLAVDRVQDIVRAHPSELEAVPAAIASRAQGETIIQSVLKIESGSRLVAILAPDKLFREDIMTRIRAEGSAAAPVTPTTTSNHDTRIFLVFSLGGQEFGLAITAVEEVARLPDTITPLPKSPDFLKGVVNLRGAVLPVIDQRQRFNYPPHDDRDVQRLVIVRIGANVAGFIVDGVTEVLRVSTDAIDPPPDAVAGARVLEGVINLEEAGRMVLLLDPSQLLSRTEQGLLDALGRVREAQAAIDQGSDR